MLKKTTIALLGIFIIPCLSLYAQSNIVGKLLDQKNHPVSFASILLLNAQDSTLVLGNISDTNGNFTLETVEAGHYLIQFSMIGFMDKFLETIHVKESGEKHDIGTVIMNEDIVQLSEVQVVAKKPLFEQKVDRMVVNVAASLTSAGNSAIEVLERTPGVLVNRAQGQLTLSGKNGVVVMINGKESRMPIEGIVSLLESMSADNIETIELIHTPPANFDAEGNAGFINIVLKKNIEDGFNGSYSLNFAYGSKPKAGVGTNFNIKKNKINLFGDYSWDYKNSPQVFSNYRSILQNGNVLETDVVSDRDPAVIHIHNARLGLDFQASDKTVFGLLVGGLYRDWSMEAFNSVTTKRNGILTEAISIPNTEENIWNHVLTNFNVSHQLSATSKINFDLDYAYYLFDNPSSYTYRFLDQNNVILSEEAQRLTKETPMNIYVGKLDYTKTISDNITFETGIKGTVTRFGNDVKVENQIAGEWVTDPVFTSDFSMEENIIASYAAISLPLGEKMDLKAGIRYEFTDTELGTIQDPLIVDRSYGRFFPSLFVSRRIDDNNSINFSYSRRINRPSFMQLAPFFIFYDPNTVLTGNPAVQPSFSDAINLNYIWKTVQFSIGYSFNDELIARWQPDFDIENNRQVTRPRNFDWGKVFSANLSIPVTITNWWNFRINLSGLYAQTRDSQEKGAEEFDVYNWNTNGSMTFKLPLNFSSELSGFYSSSGLNGAVTEKPLGRIDFALRKKLRGNSGNLSLNIFDVFFTFKHQSFIDEPDLKYSSRYQFGERHVRISYSRNFGNNKVKKARDRKTASEEERRRVN